MHAKAFHEPEHEEIALEAYLSWQAEGWPEGNADKYWFAAETQLMQQQAAREGVQWVREM